MADDILRAGLLATLTGDPRALPVALFEATIAHADAWVSVGQAEERLRDAEERTRRPASTMTAAVLEQARRELEEARVELVRVQRLERIHAGALEAIRARVDLIAAHARRTADVAVMARGVEPQKQAAGGRR